jgi:thiamine-phosphate pyrophosphorylase
VIHRIRGLYGMVDLADGSPPAGAQARALLDGGARVLQLRMKGANAAAVLEAVEELRPVCRARETLLVVNDRLDVALAGGAGGVHLGQDDLPLAEARAIARRVGPPGFLIGVSTHTEAQAVAAADGGADYLGFGPIFATSTKANPDPVVGLAGLAAVCKKVKLPVVAIGGIPVERAGDVAAAGAAAAAIISAIRRAGDPVAAARRVTAAFGLAPSAPL